LSRRINTGATLPFAGETGSAATVAKTSSEITFTDSEDELSQPLTLGKSFTSQSVTYATKATTAAADDYLDRLLKYIPAEIVALYLGVTNVVPVTYVPGKTPPEKDPGYWLALWIILALTAICTPIYMYFATREEGQPTLWSQIVISSIAFPIWAFAIGGPFQQFHWYEGKRWIAAVVISFSTFLLGLVKPKPAQTISSATTDSTSHDKAASFVEK